MDLEPCGGSDQAPGVDDEASRHDPLCGRDSRFGWCTCRYRRTASRRVDHRMPARSVVASGNDGSLGVRVSSRATVYPNPAIAGAAGSMSTVDCDRLCKLALRRM